MIGQFVLKYAVVILNIPFMYLSAAILGRPQGAEALKEAAGA
jgi:uncharacterized PurR-regulated membrane protein YhhQ (DUF165 family)